jgi:hypothetical protein
MHDADGFQVANKLDRFAIGDRDALKHNTDGSLDLYLQRELPGTDDLRTAIPAADPSGLPNAVDRRSTPGRVAKRVRVGKPDIPRWTARVAVGGAIREPIQRLRQSGRPP